MSKTPENVFKKNLGHKQQLGIWSTLGAASVAELLLNCGFDWVLIDTEHSPNELPGVIEHLRVAQAAGVPAVVRPPWNDPVLVKRLMDQGAQSLLFPYVQNAWRRRPPSLRRAFLPTATVVFPATREVQAMASGLTISSGMPTRCA